MTSSLTSYEKKRETTSHYRNLPHLEALQSSLFYQEISSLRKLMKKVFTYEVTTGATGN